MCLEPPKENKRTRILNAAESIFKGRRFDDVTLDEIAEKAGVGKGTLYLYFKNKEDLFSQMAIDGMDDMVARTRGIIAMTTPFKERLFLFGCELADFVSRRHGVMRAMDQAQSEQTDQLFNQHLRQLILAIQDLLQTGINEGALRKNFQLAELRMALVGPILLKVRRAETAGELVDVNALLEFFWAGAAEGRS